MKSISYDPSGVFIHETGLSRYDLQRMAPALDRARSEFLEQDLKLYNDQSKVPAEKQPLDAGFFGLPDRLLAEHQKNAAKSEVGRILATAKRLQDSLDRVVLLGIGGSYMGARALFDSVCHPYHNELPRDVRDKKPKLYFEGNNVDNDAASGLLEVLSKTGKPDDWGIIVISKSGGTLETAAAFRIFLNQLKDSAKGDAKKIASRIVPVCGTGGKLDDLQKALGCPEQFEVPDGVGGRFSILSAVGLLPAAVLGVDIVKLLEGAAAMNKRFREAPFEENPVLQYVAVCHGLEVRRNINIRVLSVWSKTLETLGLWYDQLLAESIGKDFLGATPLTCVNTRDLHSRAQQHQEGTRDKLMTNVIVQNVKSKPLAIGESEHDQDKLNELADKTLPDIMSAAIQGTNQAYNEAGRPTADIVLPEVNEETLGQFLQMMMIATTIEGRLMGINPFGQPGVEAYKKNMNAILRS